MVLSCLQYLVLWKNGLFGINTFYVYSGIFQTMWLTILSFNGTVVSFIWYIFHVLKIKQIVIQFSLGNLSLFIKYVCLILQFAKKYFKVKPALVVNRGNNDNTNNSSNAECMLGQKNLGHARVSYITNIFCWIKWEILLKTISCFRTYKTIL